MLGRVLLISLLFPSAVAYPPSPDPGGKVSCIVAGDPICGNYGTCEADLSSSTNWTCVCDKEYFTTAADALNHTACITKRPSGSVAIVLAAVPPTGVFGAGALYLCWYIMGTIQFMVLGGICVIAILLDCCNYNKKSKTSNSDEGRIMF